MHKRTLLVGIVLAMILVVASPPGWAAPQPQARSVVTYPTNGMIISGLVEVTGIATHPSINSYQLRYAAGPEPTGGSQWVDFAIVEGTPVENNVLATWDTTVIPDGQYTLALAVWGAGDAASPYVFFVTHLTVNNAQPVETPTPEPPTPEPMPTAVVGPTPTPISVQQPATPTPRPSPTPRIEVIDEVLTPAAAEGEGALAFLDAGELRAAFCTGGLLAVLLFALWALYMLVKAGVRWFFRQRARSSGK
jgi:hypothetical protein